jgi:phosphoglycerate dehydrogenase-like enzyme
MRQHGVAIRSRTGAALAIPALRRPTEPCFISTSGWESRNNLPSAAAGVGLMLAVYVDTVPAALAEGPETLRAAGFDVRDAVATTPPEVVAAARCATAVLVGDSPITAEVFAALPELAIVSTVTVGVDHIDLEAAMALGLVRHVPFLDRHARDGGWDCFATGPRRRPSSLTLGIVGMGRTGRWLARLAAPIFGRVAATDAAPAGAWPPGVERLGLDELLQASDVLALHAPAIRGAPPLLDAAALRLMPSGAFVVNCARGALLDVDALLAALDEGRLGGAALDVLPEEPPAPDAPVLRHPRVVVTPHAAFWSREGELDAERKQAANVTAWRRDGRPFTPVLEGRR